MKIFLKGTFEFIGQFYSFLLSGCLLTIVVFTHRYHAFVYVCVCVCVWGIHEISVNPVLPEGAEARHTAAAHMHLFYCLLCVIAVLSLLSARLLTLFILLSIFSCPTT